MDHPITIGAYVLYGKTGVCLVQEKTELSFGNGLYYVLCPVSDGRSSVYVPCDNPDLVAKMRPLLTREEIDSLLSDADDVRMDWIDDRNERSARYRQIIGSGDRRLLIRQICCLFRKKHEKQEMGKHLSAMDEAILQECMRLIDEEFSMVLEIPGSEVVNYILSRL